MTDDEVVLKRTDLLGADFLVGRLVSGKTYGCFLKPIGTHTQQGCQFVDPSEGRFGYRQISIYPQGAFGETLGKRFVIQSRRINPGTAAAVVSTKKLTQFI
jgi:hypothetical protein